jgi:hypothetical protein
MTSIFQTYDSVASFDSQFADVLDKSTTEYSPLRSKTHELFKGGQTIEFEHTTEVYTDLSESFFPIKYALAKTDVGEVGDPLDANEITVSFNMGACLFDKISLVIGDQNAASCDNVAQVESYFYRANTSGEYRNTIGSCSNLDNQESRIFRHAGGLTNFETTYTPVCLGWFTDQKKILIPPNTPLKFIFRIASNWQQRALEYIGNTNAVSGVSPGKYPLTITDFKFCATEYKGPATISDRTVYYDIRNYVSSYANLNNQALKQRLHYTVASNVFRVTLFIQGNDYTSLAASHINRFSAGPAGANEQNKLINLSIKCGNKTIPKNDAILVNNLTTTELMKVYRDTLATDGTVNIESGTETFAQWLDGSKGVNDVKHGGGYYLSYNVIRDPSENSSQMDVYVEFSSTIASPCSVFLIQHTTSIISMAYGTNGKFLRARLYESGGANA